MRAQRTSLVLVFALVVWAGRSRAHEVTVPIDLQVDLLDRVVRFERTFTAAAGQSALVLVVARRGLPKSQRASMQLVASLRKAGRFAGRRLDVRTTEFVDVAELRATISGAAVVYFAPGLTAELPAIALAFEATGVLTVAAEALDVAAGAVLGFELEGSRPRLLINRERARAQRLDFNAQMLKLARVIP